MVTMSCNHTEKRKKNIISWYVLGMLDRFFIRKFVGSVTPREKFCIKYNVNE